MLSVSPVPLSRPGRALPTLTEAQQREAEVKVRFVNPGERMGTVQVDLERKGLPPPGAPVSITSAGVRCSKARLSVVIQR